VPPRKVSPVGAHLPTSGGLVSKALPYARQIAAEAVQVFVSNPRGWATNDRGAEPDEEFRAACAAGRIPVFVHAPYLVNLASPSDTTRRRSAQAMRYAFLRARRLGARAVVVHAGSAVDPGSRAAGLGRLRAEVTPLLGELTGDDPALLIEPTAGGGAPLACNVADLESVFEALDAHPKLGVCLDTCHAFAGGTDLSAPGGVRRWLNELVSAVGKGRLGLVHANDSRDSVGSMRDRHARIGTGGIGSEPFAELFRHPATAGVPVVIETPGEAPDQAHDIALLKSLRDR
jgi:deoxyribonuclease-4